MKKEKGKIKNYRGVAKQHKPKLITHHSSLIAPDQREVH